MIGKAKHDSDGSSSPIGPMSDYYTLFYFKYIKNHYGKDEHFWMNATDNPAMRTWVGLTFEQVCMDQSICKDDKLQKNDSGSHDYHIWSQRKYV